MIEQLFQEGLEVLKSPEALRVAIIMGLTTLILIRFLQKDEISKYPLVNGKKPFQLFTTEQKNRFVADAKGLIEEGFATAGKAFRLQTDDGVQVVLSGDFADGIKDNENLNFGKISAEDMHAHIPGFEPFRQGSFSDEIFHDAVRLNLTHALSQLNYPLSAEADFALQQNWGDKSEWHEVTLKQTMMKVVSLLSSKVFLGEELCRNEDWQRLTMEYTDGAMAAAQELRLWPKPLRNYVHWFLPSCQKIRAQLAECRAIIDPVLANRRQEKAARAKQGLEPLVYLDAMEWMEQAAKGRPYDPAISQVMMALAANFSGSDTLAQVIFDLCEQPQLVEDMRKEVISVMKDSGWTKSTIYKLRLMDSVLKESQRIKPAAVATMRRYALKDTQLPDGTKLRKGTKIMVSVNQGWDESLFPNADKFDGYRFLKLREDTGQETVQFVSTGPSALGFGHGRQACPGRFFAVNELKIALSHIILKYDFKLAPGAKPKSFTHGLFYVADPTTKVMIRRRQEEIKL